MQPAYAPLARVLSIFYPQNKSAKWDEEVVSVYVNPYSGENKGARLWQETFTGFIFTLHAELAGGEFGHLVVGICGIVMLGITFTGLVLWTGWRNLVADFLLT